MVNLSSDAKKISYIDYIEMAKGNKRREYERLRSFSHQEIQNYISNKMNEIRYISSLNSTDKYYYCSILVYILIKIKMNNHDELLEILQNLLDKDNEQFCIFIQYVSAKLLKYLKKNEIEGLLDNIKNSFFNEEHSIYHAFFLYFTMVYSPKTSISCYTNFLDALKMCFYTENFDIIDLGYRTLRIFLKNLNMRNMASSEIVNSILTSEEVNLNSNKFISGISLLIAALIQEYPSFELAGKSELLDLIYSHFQNSTQKQKSILAYLLLLINSLKNSLIDSERIIKIAEYIEREAVNDPNIYTILSISSLVGTDFFSGDYTCILSLLKRAFSTNAYPILDYAYDILRKITQSQSGCDFYNQFTDELIDLFDSVNIDENFVKCISELFDMFPSFLSKYCYYFNRKIIDDPDFLSNKNVLLLFSRCSDLSNYQLLDELTPLFDSAIPEIRANSCILALQYIKDKCIKEQRDIFIRIISVGVSDSEDCVKVKILSNIPDELITNLNSEGIVKSLLSLAYDGVAKVKREVISLLNKISQVNPFLLQPVMRNLMLDTIHLLDTSIQIHDKVQNAEALRSSVFACINIIQPYILIIADTILKQLKYQPSHELTYFEKRAQKKANICFTELTQYLIMNVPQFLINHKSKYISVLIWMLKQYSSTKLKVSTLRTLLSLIMYYDDVTNDELSMVSTRLIQLSSFWDNIKLNIEVLKIFGFIGALNPLLLNQRDEQEGYEIYYYKKDKYVYTTSRLLIKLLNDDSLIEHHKNIFNLLFRTISYEKSTEYFDIFHEYITLLLEQVKDNNKFIDLLKLTIINTSRAWILPYSSQIMNIFIEKLSEENVTIIVYITDSIPFLADVLADRFFQYVPFLISHFINTLNKFADNDELVVRPILNTVVTLKNYVFRYINVLTVGLIKITRDPKVKISVKVIIIRSLRHMVQNSFSDNILPLIECFSECVVLGDQELKGECIHLLSALYITLGPNIFNLYYHNLKQLLHKVNLNVQNLDDLLNNPSKYIECSDKPIYEMQCDIDTESKNFTFSEDEFMKAYHIGPSGLLMADKAWWMNIITTTIKCSPSYYIRICSYLCNNLFSYAEKLFNIAFLSCWKSMSEDNKKIISDNLKHMCLGEVLPSNIKPTIVHLFEFMEKQKERLYISYDTLLEISQNSVLYSTAYYYAIRCVYENPTDISKLKLCIKLCNKLNLHKTKDGFLTLVQNLQNADSSLSKWDSVSTTASEYLNHLKILKHQKKWDEIIETSENLNNLINEIGTKAIQIRATALTHRYLWKKLEDIISFIPRNKVSRLLVHALFEINNSTYDKASQTIQEAYELLSNQSISVFKHNMTSLSSILVEAQQINEVNELLNKPDKLFQIWSRRTDDILCQNFENYYQIAMVRLSSFPVEKMVSTVYKLLKLSLSSGLYSQFDLIMKYLFPKTSEIDPNFKYLHCKKLWITGERNKALSNLERLIKEVGDKENYDRLRARLFHKNGYWRLHIQNANELNITDKILDSFKLSLVYDTNYYKSWHSWSIINSTLYRQNPHDQDSGILAITSTIRCIEIDNRFLLSDMLNLVSFILNFEYNEDSFNVIKDALSKFNPVRFLGVIPQLVSSIESNNIYVCSIVKHIMINLLVDHYHVLMYPLLRLIHASENQVNMDIDHLLDKSPGNASEIIKQFKNMNPKALQQTLILSRGFYKCSSTRLERAMEVITNIIYKLRNGNISEANDYFNKLVDMSDYFVSQNICKSSFDRVKIIHNENFGGDISDYEDDMFQIYLEIEKANENQDQINIDEITPELTSINDFVITFPTNYSLTNPCAIPIQRIKPRAVIYRTKLRPKVISIIDASGRTSRTILKSGENYKLQQRIIQFFALINQLLSHESSWGARNLKIIFYVIIHILFDTALMHYLENSDTLYALVSDYRQNNGRHISEENELVKNVIATNISTLLPIQRYEVLSDVLSEVNNTDIREIIWLSSPTSNGWVSRNALFSQSCALTSMIGNLIGLGDRHPSNILLNRSTGSLIHIDFTEFFNESRKRPRFPELIPFRLTGMIVSAFGPTGIEGVFRITSEKVTHMLNVNKVAISHFLHIFLQEYVENNNILSDSSNVNRTMLVEKIDDNLTFIEFNESEYYKNRRDVDAWHEKYTREKFPDNITAEQLVSSLIKAATDVYNLSHLHHGWMPLW